MSAQSAQQEGPGVWVGGGEATAGTGCLCRAARELRGRSSECVVGAGAMKFRRTLE